MLIINPWSFLSFSYKIDFSHSLSFTTFHISSHTKCSKCCEIFFWYQKTDMKIDNFSCLFLVKFSLRRCYSTHNTMRGGNTTTLKMILFFTHCCLASCQIIKQEEEEKMKKKKSRITNFSTVLSCFFFCVVV